MFKALKAFRSLSPEQKALLETKQVSGEFEPRSLIDLLRPIAEYDRLSDKARTPMGCTTAALFALSLPFLFLTLNGFWGVLPLVLLSLGGAVFLLVFVLRLRKLDLSNNFRQVAMPLFAVLKEDMEPGATMNVRLDLSSPTAKVEEDGDREAVRATASTTRSSTRRTRTRGSAAARASSTGVSCNGT